jgi:hypothetical protein
VWNALDYNNGFVFAQRAAYRSLNAPQSDAKLPVGQKLLSCSNIVEVDSCEPIGFSLRTSANPLRTAR